MQDQAIQQTTYQHFTAEDDKWPTGLKKAEQLADILGLSEEKVLEFANLGYLPHWRINGGEPLFQTAEVKRWAKKNLLQRNDGIDLPMELHISVDPPPAKTPPPKIHNLKNLRELPYTLTIPGIYFLVKGDEIVYVGQSVNPIARVNSHQQGKGFERAYLLPVPRDRLDEVEAAFIRLFRPKLNGRHSSGAMCTSAPLTDQATDEEIISSFTLTDGD